MITSFRSCLCVFTMLAVTGCERGAPKPVAVIAPAEQASHVVLPQPAEVPISGSNHSPAEGAAIGGVPANQEGGGLRKGLESAKTGGAPAPTGGDGASSSATR